MELRRLASSLIRRNPWMPLAIASAAAVSVILLLLSGSRMFWVIMSAAVLMLSSYIWGYSARALKSVQFPTLGHLGRRQYAEVWDSLAASSWEARAAACGNSVEDGVRRSAAVPVRNISELAGVEPTDNVLEIGCGVGRIGLELASRCGAWTGVDMSKNMLACAAERLHGLKNIRLVRLARVGLDEIESNSFDLVYSTNVFDHLDGMDRWRYVEEAFRVLRSRGRLFIDNTDIESNGGWAAFARGTRESVDLERPPYQPHPTTAAELATYAKRAGFLDITTHRRGSLVVLTATKPVSEPDKNI